MMRLRHKSGSHERCLEEAEAESGLDVAPSGGPPPPPPFTTTTASQPNKRRGTARTWCLSTLGLGLILIMFYTALLTFPLPHQRGLTVKTLNPKPASHTPEMVNHTIHKEMLRQAPELHNISAVLEEYRAKLETVDVEITIPVETPPPPPATKAQPSPKVAKKKTLYERLMPPALLPAKQDDGLRCRTSGICDGDHTCSSGDRLGCIVDSGGRQAAIVAAAQWTWKGYRSFAWGEDELLPLSHNHSDWFRLGLTLVDGLDTLMMMGLTDEVKEARKWVAEKLNMDQSVSVNTFETTIRILGGLLAAFHLAGGDKMYLYKALELGLRILPAFNSPTGIPLSDVDLQTHAGSLPHWMAYSSLSEVSTLDVEFSYLARVTGRPELASLPLHVMQLLSNMSGKTGHLPPKFVCPMKAVFKGREISLGARADSYYEYMLKEWIITGKKHDWLLQMYLDTIGDIRHQLLQRSAANGLLYVAELEGGDLSPKMDHLVCFLPGLLALGHLHGVNTSGPGDPDDIIVAEELAETCYEMYRQTPTGLAPEIVHFIPPDTEFPKHHRQDLGGGDFYIKPLDAHNLLRPETVESLFILWRVTRKQKYREWGWNIFRSFEQHSKVDTGGYTCLQDVTQVPPPQRDKMESFWLAETLKYLYLMFDDGAIDEKTGKKVPRFPLNEFVFNTEAHPLPVEGSPRDVEQRASYLHPGDTQWRWQGRNSSLEDLDADIQIVSNEALWHKHVEGDSQSLENT